MEKQSLKSKWVSIHKVSPLFIWRRPNLHSSSEREIWWDAVVIVMPLPLSMVVGLNGVHGTLHRIPFAFGGVTIYVDQCRGSCSGMWW